MAQGIDSKRIFSILDTVMQMATGEFSARAPVSESGDELDALAAGINMFGEELAQKFETNHALMSRLEQALEDQARQHETILQLSTPSLSVWDGILVVPVIGVLDQERSNELSQNLLERLKEDGAKVVIIDVTGLATIDTAAAKHLSNSFGAVSLLGAKCVLTGISPSNAQTMVGLGVVFTGVETRLTLREGLRLAFSLTHHVVSRSG